MADAQWVDVPAFIPETDDAARKRVSVISTAIAAGDRPESEFKVTRVDSLNPEYKRVSLIAASIAANDRPESSMTCVRVRKNSGAREEN